MKNNAADYTTNYQGKERIIVYRTGSGRMSFNHWLANGNQVTNAVSDPKAAAGGLFYINANQIDGSGKLVAHNNNYGPLKGAINSGDSGSPIFVFNNKTQEWELIGTTWGANFARNNPNVINTFFGIVRPTELDSFKKRFEVQRVANGETYQNEQNKDSVYTESGTITINEDVDQGIGGIILRGGG